LKYDQSMFLTNHVLTGTLIGLEVEQPVVIAPIAFASHFVMDGLPHFGHPKMGGFRSWKFWIIGGIDFTLACAIVVGSCLTWPDKAIRIGVGAFFAALPDLFYIPEILFNKRLDRRLRMVHSKIQWSETPPGIIVEGGWAVAVVALIRRLK
jgi:hypothetical protein